MQGYFCCYIFQSILNDFDVRMGNTIGKEPFRQHFALPNQMLFHNRQIIVVHGTGQRVPAMVEKDNGLFMGQG